MEEQHFMEEQADCFTRYITMAQYITIARYVTIARYSTIVQYVISHVA